MGSSYYGPNSDCYHCSGCGTYRACDDCSASCCQNNMSDQASIQGIRNNPDRPTEIILYEKNKHTNICLETMLNLKINKKHNKDKQNNHEKKDNNVFFFHILLLLLLI